MKHLAQKLSISRRKPENLEKQEHSASQQATYIKRREFVQLLFDLKAKELADFPGIESYCDYLEYDAFQALKGPKFAQIWPLISRTDPKTAADCWDWSLAVLQAVVQAEESEQSDQSDQEEKSEQPETSLHDVLEQLGDQTRDVKQSLKHDPDKGYSYIAIFTVLCWSSLVMRPKLIFTDNARPTPTCLPPRGFKSRTGSRETLWRATDKCLRPIVTIFGMFKLHYWGVEPDDRTKREMREADSLYAAGLSMYSLRYFGHVTIQWVDTISEHLRFNPANRRLSLFRFPTFCALFAIHGNSICSPIRRIIEEFDPLPPEDRELCSVSLAQEVILSYRLLFGQDGKSRKVAREEISKLKKSCSEHSQSIDTMLPDLCERKYEHGRVWWQSYDKVLHGYPGEIWPVTCQTMEGRLQESDVYSAQDDFPRLGRRLLRLQQFNARQRPSKLTDLWRDRRNPLQWYTFWAVVLVGGFANIMAVLQLGVAIVEMQASLTSN